MGCIIADVHSVGNHVDARVNVVSSSPNISIVASKHEHLSFSVTPKNESNTIKYIVKPLAIKGLNMSMVCTVHERTEESYTRLAYIESTGSQFIELDYQLKEDDTVDVLFNNLSTASGYKYLFGNSNTWVCSTGTVIYARFGNSSSTKIESQIYRKRIQLSKGNIIFDESVATRLDYTGVDNSNIRLFNGVGANDGSYGIFRMFFFRIVGADGNAIIDLAPAKRDRDGKIGMLDLISGKWYENVSNGDDFIGGNEISVTSDYELIDRVLFNKDKAFDTQYQGNNKTSIELMFQRTDTSTADYMFGCSPSGKARITAYLSQSGAWRYGTSLYKGFTVTDKYIYTGRVTPTGITVNEKTQTYTSTAFTTVQNIPIGGHRSSESSANITKTYKGYIYYFRMWHGSTLLLDWYPCRRKSDGMEGFWDCVTQSFIEPV